jgi:hypothetical protein
MYPFQFLFALALLSPEALVEQARKDGAKDIRIQRVQLDEDPQLEAVIQFIIPGQGVFGRVLNQDGGTWREVGKFNSWWDFEPADADRFLEFRETVAAGISDLIVRTRGGGTEVSGTELTIHRLRKGVLTSVFSLREQETSMEHPSGKVGEVAARLAFTPGRIDITTTLNPGNKKTCATYVWNEAGFRFEESSAQNNCRP